MIKELTGAEFDTLWCLFYHGPTWDGDVPSKSGRDSLVAAGYAARGHGWQWLTEAGTALCFSKGFAAKKESQDSRRRKKLHDLEEQNKHFAAALEGKITISSAALVFSSVGMSCSDEELSIMANCQDEGMLKEALFELMAHRMVARSSTEKAEKQ